jgi:hypothetical protein
MQDPKTRNVLFAFASVLMCLMLCMCAPAKEKQIEQKGTLNTSHLDALYQELLIGGDTVGIVHIYSEYPDYHMVGDADEGIACVDDASRAAIFYLRQYKATSAPEYLHKGRMLIRFLLAMQAPNGYYYNFIFPDGTINKDGSTSMPVPNFWAWRTLWAFGEALNVLDVNDPLRNPIRLQRGRLAMNILLENSFKSNATDTAMGVAFATWLPKISGTDQASIVLIGLSLMLQQESNVDSMRGGSLVDLMEHFADGIMLMQIEQPDSLHDGAFLSWENLWHAYANVQSYALMMTGQVLDDPHMISHGLYEVDHFYPAFLKAGGLEHFFVKIEENKITRYDTKSFSQIAYGRRPMIWAALKAYEITKEEKYLALAKELGEWFSGKNPANVQMFDTLTGRGYDGITSPGEYNKNSGAESTIESLLALQELEKYE